MPIPPMVDSDDIIAYQYDSHISNGIPSLFTGAYSVSEVNDRNHGKIERNLKKWNDGAEKRLSIAREASNKVPPEVFNYIIEARKSHLPELIEKVAEAHKVIEDPAGKNKRGLAPNTTQASIAIQQANMEFALQVDKDVKEKYYASRSGDKHDLLDWHIRQANVEAGLESAPSGSNKLFSNMTKSIYDKDKGGFQWGGILGGVAGFALSGIFGAGGLLGTVIAIVMTMIGVSLGNQVADNYKADSGPPVVPQEPKTPSVPAPAPEPSKNQEQSTGQEKTAETPKDETEMYIQGQPTTMSYKSKAQVNGKTSQAIDRGNLGGLQAQVFPTIERKPSADRTIN